MGGALFGLEVIIFPDFGNVLIQINVTVYSAHRMLPLGCKLEELWNWSALRVICRH